MSIKLKYFQKFTNVGDVFSEKVAQRYLSAEIQSFENIKLDANNVILIGSILEWVDEYTTICGAGLIQSSSILRAKPKHINCVRGPLTAFFLDRQGIETKRVYGDPGLLISEIYKNTQSSPVKGKIGVIPHYVDMNSAWIKYCRNLDIVVLDVLTPLEEFVDQLCQCEIILSSSLHGIVFAHSYGKPALWIEISEKVIGDGFKFYDYYLSLGVSPEKVNRYKVKEDTDPYFLQSMVQSFDCRQVISDIEEALYLTKKQMIDENLV